MDGLKHNLLVISQLCDKGYNIAFNKGCCTISNPITNQIEFVGNRISNTCMLNIDCGRSSHLTCLTSNNDISWIWKRRVAHIHMHHLNKLISKELKGLPKLKFVKNGLCDACQKGKQSRFSFEDKNMISTSRSLELLHLDLFGPSRTMSIGGKYYALIVDD